MGRDNDKEEGKKKICEEAVGEGTGALIPNVR
jgi:hypothetical protein